MTLKELIITNKLKNSNYIALYNKNERRFDGDYTNSSRLEIYMDYAAEVIDIQPRSKFIWTIKLPDYEYGLGLSYIREQERLKKEFEEAKKTKKK